MALRTMFFVSYAFALRLCYVTLTAVDRCLNGNRKGIFTIIIKLISFKSMSCSQSDSDYITSYSEDERIELERRRERIQEEQYEERVEQEREKAFSIIFKEKAHKLFILPGSCWSGPPPMKK
ncbi:unnamed protein product [Acanthoscelides obtectus]|uniref:Uncharacterized protein n=1 Tax=Acanthoscelides obtectus TaxID=200917 RepID=A0A9P0NQF0_ACAOB|nr:unnamed protein product [Acanthoscelides obtectus]CAK1678456.1 hypothetical protein AOBTE_LOCUS31913 [Acanthoscelides obtectus]